AQAGGKALPARGRAIMDKTGYRAVAQHHALAIAETEGDLRMGHGQAPDDILCMGEFAAGGFEEFEARRRRMEEVSQLDTGPRAERGRLELALAAGVDRETPGAAGARLAAGDRKAAHRADRGQRLPAESQGGDMGQVIGGALGWCVALDRKVECFGGHTHAVAA